ncbi:MAG: hypothetical protein A2X67_04530 [Ignavibacteria bacterium GWA2_55_11]|nr:MAG: hypothetical protein A2X67_04530 [Ignavibacteria bacterium GWA2_55_11]OGU68924.1 MAG: hypothetical protein A3H45_00555 [Ignavibacteria bacterium RIFCSPLOWO2_02_FULL_55_14]OGU72748.1 MAG: hypothetical protein A3G43_10305 [Ignavibacteria bacterium RIFCSPLOWO2_12_FULL_56_21]
MRFLILLFFAAAPLAAQSRPEIDRIIFDGANEIGPDRLRGAIQSQETPWGVWKWLYQNVSENIGNPPQYHDPVLLESDLWSLRRFYEDQGFYSAKVDAAVQTVDGDVRITFHIAEGVRSTIDKITIRGIESLPNRVQQQIIDDALINTGDPFVYPNVAAEFRRLIGIFSNNGFVNVQTKAKTATPKDGGTKFDVLFDFDLGKEHRFGNVEVVQDTSSVEVIDPDIVTRHIDFQSGDVYSVLKKQESEKLLNRLGIFDATRIENAGVDSSDRVVLIPMRVTVRTRAYQELTPEIGFNDEDYAFNVLAGLGYSHRNFFGGARNFNTLLRFSVRSIQDARIYRLFSKDGLQDSSLVSKVELTTQITQPYFFSNKVSLTGSLSWILDKQKDYYLPIIRSKVGVTAQTALFTRLFVDWNLEWIDPTSVSTQQDTSIRNFERQFNSILTTTLQRDDRDDIFMPSYGTLHSITVEEAGFLPHAFGGLFGTRLPYAQYLKLILTGQWYWDPGAPRGALWAARVRVGAADRYGRSQAPIPITRTFFAGGSGSIRGWKARELGAVPKPSEGGNALLETSLEDRIALFQNAGEFLFMDLQKLSLVVFADAGNIWTDRKRMRISEVAVASGFGIRYVTVAGPIRLDFGMKMYDPVAPLNRRWVTSKRFFGETFSGGVIHLGIGHAF